MLRKWELMKNDDIMNSAKYQDILAQNPNYDPKLT